MDRQIPKKEIMKTRTRRWLRYAAIAAAVAVVIFAGLRLMVPRVDAKSIEFSTVTVGELRTSVAASGTVVPEYEEILASPISARIVEVYRREGDKVEEGEPLLRLDLQAAETDYRKSLDDEQARMLQLQKLRVSQSTQLTDLKMKIKVADMNLGSKRMQLRNERYLDSIGSGTTDRVRQAELDYKTASLEVEQLKLQYDNERKVAEAEYRAQQLELEMFRKSMAESRRTLDEASIRSPRRAVLTYINASIGSSVGAGEKIATVADLTSFKAECSISDGYADRLRTGGKVTAHTAGKQLEGTITRVNPQAKNGMISFTIRFDQPESPLLRSGLKVEVRIHTSEKAGVKLIKAGPYYTGKSRVKLFVRDGDKLTARDVRLGESSYDSVEIVSGLEEGEQVAVSDMSRYGDRSKVYIK